MRTLLVLLLATALLAGCSGSDDPTATDGTTTSGTTTSGTSGTTGTGTTGPTAPGNATVLSCTVNVGGAGNGYANLPAANQNVGGCAFTGDNPITADGTVTAVTFATGCTGWSDSTPGDGMSDGVITVGDDYAEGTQFGVYCDATMAANSANSISVNLQA